MIGAVVGVQPFGGEGLSGTGPKAGGPLYLQRLLRHAAVSFGAHTIHAAPRPNADADSPTPALDTLLAWAKTHGHERFAALAEQYAHGTPLGTTLVLPGPTGERNTLSFAPRGAVLCAATSVNALLNQLAAVLATGNRAVVSGSTAALIPAGTPAPVRQRIQAVDAASLAAAAAGDRADRTRLPRGTAQRPGRPPGRAGADRGNRRRRPDRLVAAGGRARAMRQHHRGRRQCQPDDDRHLSF